MRVLSNRSFYILIIILLCSVSLIKSECLRRNDYEFILSGSVNKQSFSSPIEFNSMRCDPLCNIDTTPFFIPVLLYHAVGDVLYGSSELYVTKTEFDKQLKYLSDNGYTTIRISQIVNASLVKKPIIITFDDGYKDNFTNAYPLLKKYSMSATIFLVSSFIGKYPYLGESDIKNMGDLIDFQSHSSTHRNLISLSSSEIQSEALVSRNTISKITGRPVIAFSYPYGGYSSEVIDIVKKYYDYGLTINNGFFCPLCSNKNFEIGRIYVFRSTDITNFINHLKLQ